MLSLTGFNLAGLNKSSVNCRYISSFSVDCSDSDMVSVMFICF